MKTIPVQAGNLPIQLDLSLYGGDDFAIEIDFKDEATGNPYALSGTWLAQVRQTADSDVVLTTWNVDASQQGSGILKLSLSGTQTRSLLGLDATQWDLQNTLSGGQVRTWFRGTITTAQDVTRN